MKIRKKEHKTFLQLLVGIFLWGILMQIGGLLFSGHKIQFTVGLWTGILCSGGMAFHMLKSLETALDQDEKGAESHMRKMAVLRMGAVILICGGVIFFHLGNIIGIFLGLFSLKIAAYLQPQLDKTMGHMDKKQTKREVKE